MSGKVHSEHIVATKVLMPMGEGGGSRKVHSVHSEHIVATKMLMPVLHLELIDKFIVGNHCPNFPVRS